MICFLSGSLSKSKMTILCSSTHGPTVVECTDTPNHHFWRLSRAINRHPNPGALVCESIPKVV